MVTGPQTIDGKQYLFDDNGAMTEQKLIPDQPKQPTQPTDPKPASATTKLSDADKQAIETDLKAYVDTQVKTAVSKLTVKIV